jgi:hypothetical protein
MRKLVAFVAIALAGGALCLRPSRAMAPAQKGVRSESRTLTGHVYNSQNEPLQKAIVYLKNTKTLTIKSYITEPDGEYHFPALSPNVDYEVWAEYQGFRSDTKTLSGFDNRKQLTVTLRIHSGK